MSEKPLNRLKVVLVEHQKTNKWLAEQLGVSAVTVSKWCTNMHQPDLQTLARIAELIGCEKRELITDDFRTIIYRKDMDRQGFIDYNTRLSPENSGKAARTPNLFA